eukprot:COSAG06_NODE_5668_length_3331_cov_2.904084_1_plen_365_part_10
MKCPVRQIIDADFICPLHQQKKSKDAATTSELRITVCREWLGWARCLLDGRLARRTTQQHQQPGEAHHHHHHHHQRHTMLRTAILALCCAATAGAVPGAAAGASLSATAAAVGVADEDWQVVAPPGPPLPDGFAASYDVAGCFDPAHCGTFVVVPARCTSGDFCPGGQYARPGWTDATMCDGVPTYQAGGPGGPMLYRIYDGSDGSTVWAVGPSDALNDCCGNYLFSDSNPGRPGGAPAAPVYSAGDGWADWDNNGASGAITVTAGDGSATGDPCVSHPAACAAPHPAAVCALPAAGEPDDDVALLKLPHAQDFLGRLTFKFCDSCACLAEHSLCDELRPGLPALDTVCATSCSAPRSAEERRCH